MHIKIFLLYCPSVAPSGKFHLGLQDFCPTEDKKGILYCGMGCTGSILLRDHITLYMHRTVSHAYPDLFRMYYEAILVPT